MDPACGTLVDIGGAVHYINDSILQFSELLSAHLLALFDVQQLHVVCSGRDYTAY